MSKFIQSRYEEAVLELRSVPFALTNDYSDPNNRSGYWSSTPRIRLDPKHYDTINSLYAFFQYHGYDNWDYSDFFGHMKRVAFEKNYRGGWMYQMFDFVHPAKEKRSRWWRPAYYYRHKRSYQRKPEHQKKEKAEPRWSDSKKPWRKEKHRSGWKQHAKKTTTRGLRIETKKKMVDEDYDNVPSDKKCHWYDYY